MTPCVVFVVDDDASARASVANLLGSVGLEAWSATLKVNNWS